MLPIFIEMQLKIYVYSYTKTYPTRSPYPWGMFSYTNNMPYIACLYSYTETYPTGKAEGYVFVYE